MGVCQIGTWLRFAFVDRVGSGGTRLPRGARSGFVLRRRARVGRVGTRLNRLERFGARVKPGKRRGSKRQWSWRAIRVVVVGVLVSYAAYRAFDLVVSASTLQVQRISVRGNARMSEGQVRALADGIRGKSILTADLAIVKAWRGDTEGNLVYRMTARNFNPMMATAAKVTVAEVEELVEPGTFDPDGIHTPGIYVKRIIKGPSYEKRIEQRTTRPKVEAA